MPSFVRIVLSVFGVIFVAELPDKTALAALVLATRHKVWPVFVGSAAALAIQSLVAVAAGQLVSLLPARTVHITAGIVFLISAAAMLRHHKDEDEHREGKDTPMGFWRTTWTVFLVVFVAEWGDLTQLATAALAARYGAPLAVFLGATAALWAVAAIAAFIGDRAGKLLSGRVTQRIAATLFAIVGVALVVGVV